MSQIKVCGLSMYFIIVLHTIFKFIQETTHLLCFGHFSRTF